MMKWNSAKNYTENDMLLMQQEAVNRVRDFQTRARTAGAFFEQPQAFEQSREPDAMDDLERESPAVDFSSEARENYEAQIIEAQSRVVESSAPASVSVPTPMPTPAPVHPADPIHGLLDRLGVDSETLLILGLMFLLYNEKADNVLLLALAYLLI